MSRKPLRLLLLPLALVSLVLSFAGTMAVRANTAKTPFNPHVADVVVRPDVVVFRPVVENDGIVLTVSSERDLLVERFFKRGETPFFEPLDLRGNPVGDCTFTWQLSALPVVDPSVQEILKDARDKGDTSIIWDLRDEGLLPPGPMIQNGYVNTVDGRFSDPDKQEPNPKKQGSGEARDMASDALGFAAGESRLENVSAADFVILDDLIVDGSACIGFDCVNGEVFGFDTIRLKENNLRIKFDDTSVAASFPRNDWQLTANDSANGGASKFSIDDISGGRTPFTVEANAPSHSLYVDDGGRVGFGTSTPVVDLHVKDGDTPTLRLEQDGSSGFAPQTWDVAGNETSFFIRDATNGSTLPFRIRPGAASQSLVIDSDDDVGIGVLSPDAALHVRGTDGNTQVHVEEASGTDALRTLLVIENNGGTQMDFIDNDLVRTWQFRTAGNNFVIDSDQSGGVDMRLRGSATDANVTLEVLGAIEVGGVPLNVPDYVFENDYPLMPLSELRSFIAANKHLPSVPNAESINGGRLNLGDFQMRLLEKVEELTLYTLAQQESIDALLEQNVALVEELQALKQE